MVDLKSYLEIFRDSKNKSDLELVEILEKEISNSEAKRIIVFTPILLGRIHLRSKYENLIFSIEYHENSTLQNVSLKEDETCNIIYEFGLNDHKDKILDEGLHKTIILRSPEIKGAIKILEHESRVDGANFRTLITV